MSYSALDTKKVIDVIKYRWLWLAISCLLLLPGIIAMFISVTKYPTHTPLRVGIDFTGGSIIQYVVNENIPPEKISEIRVRLTENDIENPVLQVLKPSTVEEGNENAHLLSVKTQFDEEKQNELTDKITNTVQEFYPEAEVIQTNAVGPVLGKQLLVNSMIAVSLAVLAIIIYITVRFRFDYAISAIIALCHDVLFVLGVFSILGLVCGVHVDSLFVTAILTVLGYSVNDTIVVFDRVRENYKFYSKKATYNEIVNASVNQTLARSINTSLTTMLILCALYFFGGVTTKDFVLVMILGIAIGTYSSIFFASTILALINEINESKKAKIGA
ncbi:protein translocase subunit SecF [bacterium]|nr:protein translocase subunit SecF [bacterium]